MRRAVHRLQRHPVALARHERRVVILGVRHLVGDDEHVLAIFAPMPGLLPLAGVHQLRRLDLAIAGGVDRATHIRLELAPDQIALGVPEHRSMRFGLEVEQVHLLPQLAMVALARFLQPEQMLVELLLVEPARAVNPAEHRVILIAAPIRARNPREFETRSDRAWPVEARCGPRHMSSHASGALPALYTVSSSPSGSSAAHSALKLSPCCCQRAIRSARLHTSRISGSSLAMIVRIAASDRGQIVLGESAIPGREIVIEAVVGGRPERDLRVRKQMLHRLRQHMREIVAREFERVLLVAARHQGEAGIGLQRPADVAQLAIDPRSDRRLGEARARSKQRYLPAWCRARRRARNRRGA